MKNDSLYVSNELIRFDEKMIRFVCLCCVKRMLSEMYNWSRMSCAAHDEQLKLFIFIEAEGNIARAIFPSNNS